MENDRNYELEMSLPMTAFTPRAEDAFYAVVDHPEFVGHDSRLIYDALRNEMKPVSFGDQLKRYIYLKAEMREPFETIPLEEYLNIIVDSFGHRGVPASFQPTTGRVRALARNWLTQQNVSRDAALLLGFGLKMSLEEVEELLTKGMLETRLNLRDPKEILCGYCYAHGLGFYTYQNLELACAERSKQTDNGKLPLTEIKTIQDLETEEQLLGYVAGLLSTEPGKSRAQMEAGKQLRQLYAQAQKTSADILNSVEQDTAVLQAMAEAEQLSLSDQFYDYQKQAWILQAKTRARKWTPEEITPGDIEQILQAAIPKDRHGNLIPMKKSISYIPFRGWRLSRQRLTGLLAETIPVTRYDLLTLLFFVCAHEGAETESRLRFYDQFLAQANQMLEECGMAPVYTANPYECFLLMCVLSDNPLGTYSDVIEQSYMEADA